MPAYRTQIACSEITAQISVSGTVIFSDPPSQSQYTKADVDRVLRESEEQASLLKRLEMEMVRSRDYLSKVSRYFVQVLASFSCADHLPRPFEAKKTRRGFP